MAYIENTLPYLPQEIWDKIYDKKEEIELYELRKFDTKLFIQDIPSLIQFIDFWDKYRLLLRDDSFNDHPLHTEFKNQIITSNISDFRQITDHMFSHTVWKFLEMMLYKNLNINPIFLEKLLNYFTCKCNVGTALKSDFYSCAVKDPCSLEVLGALTGSKYDKDDFKDLQEDAKNSGHSPATAMGIYVSNEIPV